MINVNGCVRVRILDQNRREKRLPVCWHFTQRIRRTRVFFFIWKIVQMKNIYCRPLLNKSEAEYKPLVENVHHILMLSRGWSNEDCNKVKLFVPLHDAFHRVFWNGTIQEQLFQLMWINSKWLTDEFKKDVMKILKESDQEYYYKNGVFRK